MNSYANSNKIQEDILPFQSKIARQRLIESKYNNDFFELVNFYQPQINPLYCSIATAVMILNAFAHKEGEIIPSQKNAEIQKPEELGGKIIEFNAYLQDGFLNDKTNKIKKKEQIELVEPVSQKNNKKQYDPGLNLQEFANILTKIHNLKVKKIYAKKNDEKSITKFRNNLKKYLQDDENFVVANFDGKEIGVETRGHISPVAAYHEASDSVLILDVALHKNSWYFVSVEKLHKAMNTKDGKNFRGYLIISK